MNPTNMLELQKLVLENLYQNKVFFEKELRKSFQWLGYEDLNRLYNWSIRKFNEQCKGIIDRVYTGFDFWNSDKKNGYDDNLSFNLKTI
jgi:hypothetical protein